MPHRVLAHRIAVDAFEGGLLYPHNNFHVLSESLCPQTKTPPSRQQPQQKQGEYWTAERIIAYETGQPISSVVAPSPSVSQMSTLKQRPTAERVDSAMQPTQEYWTIEKIRSYDMGVEGMRRADGGR